VVKLFSGVDFNRKQKSEPKSLCQFNFSEPCLCLLCTPSHPSCLDIDPVLTWAVRRCVQRRFAHIRSKKKHGRVGGGAQNDGAAVDEDVASNRMQEVRDLSMCEESSRVTTGQNQVRLPKVVAREPFF